MGHDPEPKQVRGGRERRWEGKAPGGSHVGRLLRVVINDSIVDIPRQAVIV